MSEKAEAWEKFTNAVKRWWGADDTPEVHRALADAACEYAGKRVARHVAEEREAKVEPPQPGRFAETARRIWASGVFNDADFASPSAAPTATATTESRTQLGDGWKPEPRPKTVAALLAVGGPFTAEGKLILAERDALKRDFDHTFEQLKLVVEVLQQRASIDPSNENDRACDAVRRTADERDEARGQASEAPRRRVDAYTMGDELGLKRLEDMETTAAKVVPPPEATETRSDASPFAGHTPGPWHVVSDGVYVSDHPAGFGRIIARVDSHSDRPLIAAAPALLAERDAYRDAAEIRRKSLDAAIAERDALLKENAGYVEELAHRLREMERHSDETQEARRERDEARAEVERLKAVMDDSEYPLEGSEPTHARIRHLEKDRAHTNKRRIAAVMERDAARAEVERLKARTDSPSLVLLKERNAGLEAALREAYDAFGEGSPPRLRAQSALEKWGKKS